MFAANLIFDSILDDLVVSDADRERLGVEWFVDEHLPSRLRHRYDASFLRKLLATAAKVAQNLASEEFHPPGLHGRRTRPVGDPAGWEVLLDPTELGSCLDRAVEVPVRGPRLRVPDGPDMDGVEDDPLVHKTSSDEVRPFAEWFIPFNRPGSTPTRSS